MTIAALSSDIRACRICADRFAATQTAHEPRPVVWIGSSTPRILIAGQAPGARVHASGRPFSDPSGDRLRAWMGITEAEFYDRTSIAIVPMAFCFPGYDAKGSDLPPPKVCAHTWRAAVFQELGRIPLTLLVGGYAQVWHLGGRASVESRVAAWRETAPTVFPLPHPSWRTTGWRRRNPWFETDLLPALRSRVAGVLG
ncbi:MAG: uracil-DNA glycosylase family protein [Pseudomonadota bacterium]